MGKQLIEKAYEKDLDEMIYQRWLVDYSKMDKKSFVSFADYKKKFVTKPVDTRSMEDVLKEAEEITLKISKKRGE